MARPKRLLIEDRPITVSPTLATALGINEAILLQQLHFLLSITEESKNRYNFVNGRYWVYNSYKKWKAEHFPWLHEGTIKRLFLTLEEWGLVDSMQSVKNPSDREKWYSIDYDALDGLEATIGTNCDDGSMEQIVTMVGTNCDDGYTESTQRPPEITKRISHGEKSNGDFSRGQPSETPDQPSLLSPSDCSVEPSIPENGSKQGKAKGHKKTPPHPNTQPIMDAYTEALGRNPPNYAKEAASAKKMAEEGYTPEQVVAVYRTMKEDRFWSDKFLSLVRVHDQIGETYPPNRGATNGGPPPPKYRFLNLDNLYS